MSAAGARSACPSTVVASPASEWALTSMEMREAAVSDGQGERRWTRQLPTIRVIDADTHLTEPADLWTARIPARFRDEAPSGPLRRAKRYVALGHRGPLVQPGRQLQHGRMEGVPAVVPADPERRRSGLLRRQGPAGPHGLRTASTRRCCTPTSSRSRATRSWRSRTSALKLACVQTYNDYVSEFASVGPEAIRPPDDHALLGPRRLDRRAPAVPCHGPSGHPVGGHAREARAARLRRPALGPARTQWPRNSECRSTSTSGVGNTAEEIEQAMNREDYDPAFQTARSSMSFVGNVRTIGTLLTSGLCDRFPRLDFVSVESGFGYIPFLLDALDWQWHRNRGPAPLSRAAAAERVLPSAGLLDVLVREGIVGAIAASTRTTSCSKRTFRTRRACIRVRRAIRPGRLRSSDGTPPSSARTVMRKVLQENACRVYHID